MFVLRLKRKLEQMKLQKKFPVINCPRLVSVISSLNGISIFMGYLKLEPPLLKNKSGTY